MRAEAVEAWNARPAPSVSREAVARIVDREAFDANKSPAPAISERWIHVTKYWAERIQSAYDRADEIIAMLGAQP
jgi:hypothetical protein